VRTGEYNFSCSREDGIYKRAHGQSYKRRKSAAQQRLVLQLTFDWFTFDRRIQRCDSHTSPSAQHSAPVLLLHKVPSSTGILPVPMTVRTRLLLLHALPANSNQLLVRAPCPMLNTLANHNFLPHDGKAITLDRVRYALGTALNMSQEFSDFLFSEAITTSPETNATTFSLHDLGRHNILEHDASLSYVLF
jgi:hypothetical protein